jgi:hypothetical protein
MDKLEKITVEEDYVRMKPDEKKEHEHHSHEGHDHSHSK